MDASDLLGFKDKKREVVTLDTALLAARVAFDSGRARAFEEAVEWIRAEGKPCGCAERIEKNLRVAMRIAGNKTEGFK